MILNLVKDFIVQIFSAAAISEVLSTFDLALTSAQATRFMCLSLQLSRCLGENIHRVRQIKRWGTGRRRNDPTETAPVRTRRLFRLIGATR